MHFMLTMLINLVNVVRVADTLRQIVVCNFVFIKNDIFIYLRIVSVRGRYSSMSQDAFDIPTQVVQLKPCLPKSRAFPLTDAKLR